jgi:serine/threonine protein kinase
MVSDLGGHQRVISTRQEQVLVDSTNNPAGARVLVGRYRLGERIGRGGMGDVYRATDQVLARQVAVKLFRPDVSDEALDQRHESEARVLAGLNHPGLVSVYDIGTDDEQPFLVMELVEGETLADLIRRGPLAPAQVASLGGQLADSLQAIHDAGVIHRDIKPANVLVCGSDDGAALRTKLTDFGIARLVDGTRLTSTGLLIGTVQYLSPEQTVGGTVSLPSDVYALGLVLLECLTGRAAFPGVGIETAVVRLSRQPEIPAELGPRWAGVLGAMTAREPEQRPTAGEVASLLSALPAPGSGEQDAASVRPVAPAAAATPAAAAAPAGDRAHGGPPTEVSLVPARAGASRRRRRRAWSVSVGAAAALATAVTVAATWSGTSATGEPATGATSPAPSRTASAAHEQTADPASAASPDRGTTGTRASSRHGDTTSAPDPGPSSPTASPTGQQSSTTSGPTPGPASAPPTTAPESSDEATTPVTSASGTPGPDRTGDGAPPTGQATTPSPEATQPTTQPSPTSDQPGKGGKPGQGDKPTKRKPKGKDHPAPGQPTGGPTSPAGNGSGRGGVSPVVGQP